MKKIDKTNATIGYKIILSLFILFSFCNKAEAGIFNWTGATNSYWDVGSNWTVGGITQAAPPTAADNVQIGVLNTFANQPIVRDARTCANLYFGFLGTIVLTVNTATPSPLTGLTVSGNIIQYASATVLLPAFSGTTLAGTGFLTCNNFQVGDMVTSDAALSNTLTVTSQIASLTIANNLNIYSTDISVLFVGVGYNNSVFSLQSGITTIGGQIYTLDTKLGVLPLVTNASAKFSVDLTGTYNPVLTLYNTLAINPGSIAGSIDFYNNVGGTGTSTVYYSGVAQNIYANTTAALDNAPQTYQNLLITGTGAATVYGGTLLVGNNLFTSAPYVFFNTNNPAVSIGGSWTNSSNVMQGTGNITVGAALTNNSGGVLNLSSANLYIAGNYTNNAGGIYTQSTGTTYFNGSGAQALVDVSVPGTLFNTVSFTGSSLSIPKTMSGSGGFFINSTGMLKMVGSTTKLDAGGALTLLSAATSTATVDAIPTGSIIINSVNVQRYITGGVGYRGYRLLSSPVYGSTDASGNNIASINYLKNSAYLTGTTGVPGGFDKAGNPTLYLYRENTVPSNTTFISGNYRGINTLGTAPNYNYLIDGDAGTFNIPAGNGYLFFFRGNRAATTLAAETTLGYIPVTATLSTAGALNQGQVIVHDWYTPASANLGYTVVGAGNGPTTNYAVRGFNFVGNPYASSIDWETYNTSSTTTGIYGSNLSTLIYEFNPATQNYDTYQKGGAYTNYGSNVIASGQGFFVLAANASAQLIFNESAKTISQNSGLNLFMATGNNVAALQNNPASHMRLQLAMDTINTDDIYIGFNTAAKTQYVFNEDAPYKAGMGKVSLASISSDNMALAINILPLPKTSDTVWLKINAAADGIYKLNMTEMAAIPQLYEVWLMDNYKKDSLDIRNNKTYAFNMWHSDTSSYGTKRFCLVIRQNPALGVHLLNFAAAKITAGAETTWKTENEQNYTNFTVERSTDNGATFKVVGGYASSGLGTYTLLDKNPPVSQDMYRLKTIDLDSNVTYSKIVTLNYLNNNQPANNISLYPNPATSVVNMSVNQGSVSVDSLGPPPGYTIPATTIYNVTIINSSGAVVATSKSAQPTWQNNVATLIPGTYIVQVVNSADSSMVGKAKFIKQ